MTTKKKKRGVCDLCGFGPVPRTRFVYESPCVDEKPVVFWLCDICFDSPVSFALYDDPEARVLKAIGWCCNVILRKLEEPR